MGSNLVSGLDKELLYVLIPLDLVVGYVCYSTYRKLSSVREIDGTITTIICDQNSGKSYSQRGSKQSISDTLYTGLNNGNNSYQNNGRGFLSNTNANRNVYTSNQGNIKADTNNNNVDENTYKYYMCTLKVEYDTNQLFPIYGKNKDLNNSTKLSTNTKTITFNNVKTYSKLAENQEVLLEVLDSSDVSRRPKITLKMQHSFYDEIFTEFVVCIILEIILLGLSFDLIRK